MTTRHHGMQIRQTAIQPCSPVFQLPGIPVMPCSSARRSRPQPDFSDLDLEVDPLPQPPSDPAIAACRMLLARALEAAGTSVAEAGRDGAVCLVMVPLPWTEIVKETWKGFARRGERYEDGPQGR